MKRRYRAMAGLVLVGCLEPNPNQRMQEDIGLGGDLPFSPQDAAILPDLLRRRVNRDPFWAVGEIHLSQQNGGARGGIVIHLWRKI